ncbi:MAG: hypothetical protein AABW53_02620 [Nanoarchaeota archaeon]
MKRKELLKLIGVGVLVILLLNLLLFALRIITTLVFWVIIILAAVFVYKVLPNLKK